MSSMAAASGTRAWLGNRRMRWLTPRRLRSATIALFGAALLASAVLMTGSTPKPAHAQAPAAHAVSR